MGILPRAHSCAFDAAALPVSPLMTTRERPVLTVLSRAAGLLTAALTCQGAGARGLKASAVMCWFRFSVSAASGSRPGSREPAVSESMDCTEAKHQGQLCAS